MFMSRAIGSASGMHSRKTVGIRRLIALITLHLEFPTLWIQWIRELLL